MPALERAALEGQDHLELRLRMAKHLQRCVGFDVACVATLDPVTAMWTQCTPVGMERDPGFERLTFEAEYRHADVATLAELVTRPRPSAVLSIETEGKLETSPRYRLAFEPFGMSDELRLVLVDAHVPWGVIHLLRGSGARFGAEEAEALASLSTPFARLLRHSLLRTATQATESGLASPPGLVVLDAHDRVADVSEQAAALLGGVSDESLPQAAYALAAQIRAGKTASASLAGAAGGVLRLHGTRLGDRVAIMIERARALELADIVVRALGLTAREREVVREVARGRSTKEISSALGIKEWTVQDHLKSIFAKTGVTTRQELVAALFFGHWEPEHARMGTPSVYGHYLKPR